MPLNLRELNNRIGRRKHGEIAEVAGMHRPTLVRILSGKHTPRLETLERLATALKCKVADLIMEKKK